MSKISLDLSSIKSPGVYTIEIDESQRTETIAQALRILVGFNGKGPFNRPVFLQNDAQRQKIYGDIDAKLEKKNCFFNRAAKTMLQAGPILALNLLKVDDSYEGPDQVNYTSLSLDAAKSNPVVADAGKVYGEVDYLADSIDNKVYGTKAGDVIPFVGKTPYASLFDRSRFWIPSENNLMQVAAAGLGVGGNSFEKANFLNFANCGTDEISILVFKPEGFTGYDVTAAEWYGGAQNIPYGWIRPSDYISDYFIRVVAVKGNWTNYPLLASDKTWGKYFDKNGIKKEKIFQFCQAEGIQFVGSWTGVIFDFTDKQGNHLYIKDRVNAQSQTTGLLMAVNEDAMEVISYDLNGMDKETGEPGGVGAWIYDYDGNAEGDSDAAESAVGENSFIIDMVGHGFQKGLKNETKIEALQTSLDSNIFDGGTGTLNGVTGKKVWYIDNASVTSVGADVNTKVKVPSFDNNGKLQLLYAVSADGHVLADEYCYVVVPKDGLSGMTQTKIKNAKGYNAAGKEGTKTIKQIVDAEGITSELKLVNDLQDNTLYTEADAYFGDYAAYDPTAGLLYVYSIDSEGVRDEGIVSKENMEETSVEIGNTATDVYKIAVKSAGVTIMIRKSDNAMFIEEEGTTPVLFGINFMSYNFVSETESDVIAHVRNARYFNGRTNTATGTDPVSLSDNSENDLFFGNAPVGANVLNQFVVTDESEAAKLTVGDLVQNITFNNRMDEAMKFGLIPGVTRVTKKIFVNLTSDNKFTYNGNTYRFNTAVTNPILTRTGKRGFYLITAIDPVLISSNSRITRQLPISSPVISESLRFIPLKGLHISAKHRPGYDEKGRISTEGGIRKIYSVLEEDGIHRALCDTKSISFRYIIDSCSGGLDNEMGGKVYLSRLAMDRGKCTALLNAPSKHQFETSSDPVFCDTYNANDYVKPSFNTKYIPLGGNVDMYNTKQFSLPTELNGSKYSAAFFPYLLYSDNNGRTIIVPPAADVSNVMVRKFQGGDPYVIAANQNGIITNGYVTGVEYNLDTEDADYLDPFGITLIRRNAAGRVHIYGNQTCYQDTKSDFNKLHVRENLNTLELACDEVFDYYSFKYNNAQTRSQLTQNLVPILETMKNSGALDWYEIKCDEENNTPEVIAASTLICDIAVVMGMGCEKIINRITLKTRDAITE